MKAVSKANPDGIMPGGSFDVAKTESALRRWVQVCPVLEPVPTNIIEIY